MSTTSETTPKPSRRFARELTSLAASPIIIWLIGWAPNWAYIAFIAVASCLALWEFLELGRKKGYRVNRIGAIILGLILESAFIEHGLSVEIGVFTILLAVPTFYIFSGGSLEEALPGTAVSTLATLYIGMLSGALLRLRLDFDQGAKLIFFLLIVVWMGDAGAYYVGSKIGKRKLSPRISPKKSVEGLIGGVLTSIASGIGVHFAFFREFPLIHVIICATILSLAGVIGDLAESLWKRSAAVKDSGTLIPGHGGFLDRLDSILFTAPLLYAYWFLLQNDFQLTQVP